MSSTIISPDDKKLLEKHLQDFEQRFCDSSGEIVKMPRDQHWRPVRFAVRDVIFGVLVLKHEAKNNIILVDFCLSDDPLEIDGYSGTKIATIFILSEAYKSGSSMGIRFTSNFGKESRQVPGKIYDLAYDYGVELKKASEGVITPKEARYLYLALTEFHPEVEKFVMELSLADRISPERICYMVHHLTYTKDEMESLLMGSEFPEHALLGEVTPEEYMLYRDAVLRLRDVVLGGTPERLIVS